MKVSGFRKCPPCPSSQCPALRALQAQINSLRAVIAELRRQGDANSKRIRALTRRLRRLIELVRELAARENSVGLAAYGHVYNLTTGLGTPTIAAGADVPFSNNGILNNVTHTPGATAVSLPLVGDYEVIYQVNALGGVASLLAAFGIAVNGVVVPGSVFANSVVGVGVSSQVNGSAIIRVPAGATITLRNVSGVAVPLTNTLIGGLTPFNNASLTVKKLGPVGPVS